MSTLMAREEEGGILRLRWTPEALEDAVRSGSLDAERRYEILNGDLYEKMGQNWPHMFAVAALQMAFQGLNLETFYVAIQAPLRAAQDQPEPDFKVVRGGYRGRRATPSADETLLVVEVSDTTYRTDSRIKAPIYAASGVPVYWIVDIHRKRVEVHTRPEAGAYAETRIFEPGDELPVAFEGCPAVSVSMLFMEEA